ncbi:MAG: type II toxin-antitoxin system mRNA interferase toxin, RelE/StbE family [Candidatus Komeilibacteria bacterium]|nr:type II toxin-antitoxin system mRNA interferase toxin, RelE/StbE family [Candidatus Komeilibacteria bacterium]
MKSGLPLAIFHLPKFRRLYKKLPEQIQELAKKKEIIFRQNPFDPTLNTHKLHGPLDGFWAFYINFEYRVIFDFAGRKTVRFYAIGNHDIYQ